MTDEYIGCAKISEEELSFTEAQEKWIKDILGHEPKPTNHHVACSADRKLPVGCNGCSCKTIAQSEYLRGFKLTQEEITTYYKDLNSGSHPDFIRYGQYAFNTLYVSQPDLANAITGTYLDPFYNDNKLEMFFDFLLSIVDTPKSL
jgi:hypothetical protein